MITKVINQKTICRFSPRIADLGPSLVSARSAKIAGLAFVLMFLVGCSNNPRGFHSVLEKLPDPALRTNAQPPKPAPVPEPAPVVQAPAPVPVAPAPQAPANGVTIVIDAGHGGKDPGAMNHKSWVIPEKRMTLSIALQVGQILQSRGYNVIYTRSDDHFIELDERANISNRSNAYLFVAIHIDSSRNSQATGATVYTSRNPSSKSQQAARCISASLKNTGIECRGVKRANYRVLAANDQPCVLVECGFISNSVEAQRLCNLGYQAQVASAIANGVINCAGQ
jgi:N-acetylmuramoyl-L-alanine amidase